MSKPADMTYQCICSKWSTWSSTDSNRSSSWCIASAYNSNLWDSVVYSAVSQALWENYWSYLAGTLSQAINWVSILTAVILCCHVPNIGFARVENGKGKKVGKASFKINWKIFRIKVAFYSSKIDVLDNWKRKAVITRVQRKHLS